MSNPTVNSVFEAFIEADKAMKELPAIREEKARLERQYEDALVHGLETESRLGGALKAIEELKASLAQREAELAHATFRADAVEAKHRALRSILSSGDDHVVAVDGALNVFEALPDHSEVFPASDPQSPGPTGSQSSESGLESLGQSENNPTPNEATMADQSISTAQGNGDIASLGQSDVDPTAPTNGTSPAPQPENPTSAPGPSNNPSDEGSVSAGESGMFIGESASPPLAFSGQPSTRKPEGMEWGYWIVNGGEAAIWMGDQYIAVLKANYSNWAGHAKAAAE